MASFLMTQVLLLLLLAVSIWAVCWITQKYRDMIENNKRIKRTKKEEVKKKKTKREVRKDVGKERV
jgi:biopolymer transport protein ExbB/TolQ